MSLNKKDFRTEIPVRALLNAIIIQELENTEALEACTRAVLKKAGFASGLQYQLRNPAYIVGLLYCLIVVPKELWLTGPNDPIYQELEEKKLLDLFEITIQDKLFAAHPMYHLIRHLRNSLAHVRFSIDARQGFTFWDQIKSGDSPPTWEASASNENLMDFATKVAHVVVYLHDTRPVRPD